jgi:hypothetical protein
MQAVAARESCSVDGVASLLDPRRADAYARQQALDLLELTNSLDASADVFLCTSAG